MRDNTTSSCISSSSSSSHAESAPTTLLLLIPAGASLTKRTPLWWAWKSSRASLGLERLYASPLRAK